MIIKNNKEISSKLRKEVKSGSLEKASWHEIVKNIAKVRQYMFHIKKYCFFHFVSDDPWRNNNKENVVKLSLRYTSVGIRDRGYSQIKK